MNGNSDTEQKLCFVVMGFGKKTDYEFGRTFDLDATYEAIIEPAVTALGLRCVRADEVLHSGLIDLPMFQMLLQADLVIADISTGNVNAIYELGVRHAFKPNATIVMKENKGKLSFDLNHINTFQYEHLGEDIGVREARRAKEALTKLIETVLDAKQPDSPIYSVLPNLRQPVLPRTAFKALVNKVELAQDRLSSLIKEGQAALKESKTSDAAEAFQKALEIKSDDVYLIQQRTLATYKSEKPNKLDALLKAWEILKPLKPEESNDPETLGLAGAIHKRLFQQRALKVDLEEAIRYYRRGFEISRDYYNGENLATLYDLRAGLDESRAESQYDRMSARKVRESTVDILRDILKGPSFEERSDHKWIYATMANSLFALDQNKEALQFEKRFYNESSADWERDSYEKGKKDMLISLGKTPR